MASVKELRMGKENALPAKQQPKRPDARRLARVLAGALAVAGPVGCYGSMDGGICPSANPARCEVEGETTSICSAESGRSVLRDGYAFEVHVGDGSAKVRIYEDNENCSELREVEVAERRIPIQVELPGGTYRVGLIREGGELKVLVQKQVDDTINLER